MQTARGFQSGFTLIELLIATFIIGTIVTGLFGMFVLNLRQAQESERRLVGIALANERAEMIRNLPYAQVGTSGGVPPGAIAQEEVLVRNGLSYTITTDIRYIDDPFDGLADGGSGGGCLEVCHHPPGQPGNSQSLCVSQASYNAHISHGDTAGSCGGAAGNQADFLNTDYKQARIEVVWQTPQQVKPILLLLQITPDGIEGGEAAGTLDFQALNAAGAGVADADVHITNSTVSPQIDVTTATNNEGRVVLPGFPPSSDHYHLAVTKDGFTSEQTYPATANFTPDADHAPLSMQQGVITPKTFFIDAASSIQVTTRDESGAALPSIAYQLRGSKTIGVNAAGEPVYVTDKNDQTNLLGTHAYAGILWDVYDFTINGPLTGYDIKETSRLLPLAVVAGEAVELEVRLRPHTDHTLHVTVTSPAGEPVDNATVKLLVTGVEQEESTGAVGQVLFSDLPADGEYALTIDAPGFSPFAVTTAVAGNTRLRAELTVAP